MTAGPAVAMADRDTSHRKVPPASQSNIAVLHSVDVQQHGMAGGRSIGRLGSPLTCIAIGRPVGRNKQVMSVSAYATRPTARPAKAKRPRPFD